MLAEIKLLQAVQFLLKYVPFELHPIGQVAAPLHVSPNLNHKVEETFGLPDEKHGGPSQQFQSPNTNTQHLGANSNSWGRQEETSFGMPAVNDGFGTGSSNDHPQQLKKPKDLSAFSAKAGTVIIIAPTQ